MTPGAAPACPPHRWEVTSLRRDGALYYHHRCLRCAAEKDVPVADATRPRRGTVPIVRRASAEAWARR